MRKLWIIFRAVSGILLVVFVCSYGINHGYGWLYSSLAALGAVEFYNIVVKSVRESIAKH